MTKPFTVLIANAFDQPTIEKLDAHFHTHKLWLLSASEQKELIRQLSPHCRAVASGSWATNPLIYELPNLEIIVCFGVGVDGIDFGITRSRNIAVTNTPRVLDDAVADIAIGLILSLQRNLFNADQFVREGKWLKGSFPLNRGLAGKTLGILGLGNIGNEIALRALSLKMNIAYHNRHPRDFPYQYYADVKALALNSDILVCTLPGTNETRQVINRDVLKHLGPQGLFVNVGRGSCVNETDLVQALQDGTIAGAALDVYNNEPKVPEPLLQMQNVILLPHIGSGTVETRQAMGQLVIDNLLACESGTSLLTVVS